MRSEAPLRNPAAFKPASSARSLLRASWSSLVLNTICLAINAKQVLRVRYHDKVRLVEPYLLGEYADNRPFLLAWMTQCEDDPAKEPGWQHYLVSQIGSLEVLPQTFDGVRADYNPAGDTRISRILCSIPALRLL